MGGGLGAFIGSVHRIAARLDDHYELVAGALSSDPVRAEASARDVRIAAERSYNDYRLMAQAEAARDDGIDVVVIVTPNHLHAPVATAFLEAGIHVICDKPLGISLAEGKQLAALARRRNKLFALTHTYTGYPMVRHAKAMVEAGEIGELRLVQVEYAQDWLAASIGRADTGAEHNWHNDPLRAGPGGTLSDVGTHAYHLAQFVSGQLPTQLLAELNTFVPGRPIDDHVQVMLRYANGARGTLWASQVATGCENTVRLRLYGSKAQLDFNQEKPTELWFTPQGGNPQRLSPGRVGSAAAAHATRMAAGHPEGYLEAFAQLYVDAAQHIIALDAGLPIPPAARWLPTVDDGVAGMAFIDAVLSSHQHDGRWTDLPPVS
ncbi:oxidoreductase, NAD-binding Rossmann fold family protein [Janthinobacterium agaricidamnosum NBRC 102515 = DSM 9628]|uniref:Oxidoreductase, NAD-binding Rossmann fold family protein n=1 Tax=Janthinobacterium agaricidamnosum NBRC 102515 = DSM 9628 TaxID=1349767 RepID=W0VDH5_9BURK|nr:oxidoreductase, NAD-binding Rossmann fold family protein [Janthinobacterium agaricidamnosum NBRC 102515 = DSM 9628]